MSKQLTVIIPAYNEELYIEHAINETLKFLKLKNFDYEIIVVNDGSKDKTKDIILRYDNVIYIENEVNKGKGHSVKKGILSSTKSKILFLDADFSASIVELLKLYNYSYSHDIVIGSRNLESSTILVKQKPIRRFLGKAYLFVCKMLFPYLKIKDTQCGFKLFDRETILNIIKNSNINGYCFDLEILLKAKKCGYKIIEIPIIWTAHNSTSKVYGFISGFKMLYEVILLKINE
jgi:dolichyl-phosphate beta-glucosyltransferase